MFRVKCVATAVFVAFISMPLLMELGWRFSARVLSANEIRWNLSDSAANPLASGRPQCPRPRG